MKGVRTMRATMTIAGLYNYNPELFDGMRHNIPEGVQLEAVRYAILQNCGDLQAVIPNADLLVTLITAWSYRKSRGWTRYQAAISTQYSPLENYDRIEETSEDETGTSGSTTESTGTDSRNRNNTETRNLTDEHQVSAFNQTTTYSPQYKDTHTGTDANSGGESGRSTVNSEGSGEYARNRVLETRTHGNIGVTTSQQMLTSELELTPLLDIYTRIADDFKREFCVMVY